MERKVQLRTILKIKNWWKPISPHETLLRLRVGDDLFEGKIADLWERPLIPCWKA